MCQSPRDTVRHWLAALALNGYSYATITVGCYYSVCIIPSLRHDTATTAPSTLVLSMKNPASCRVISEQFPQQCGVFVWFSHTKIPSCPLRCGQPVCRLRILRAGVGKPEHKAHQPSH